MVAPLKLFSVAGSQTWYIAEYDPGDGILWGFCESGLGADCDEFGSVSLAELAELGGVIERDRHYTPRSFGEIRANLLRPLGAAAVIACEFCVQGAEIISQRAVVNAEARNRRDRRVHNGPLELNGRAILRLLLKQGFHARALAADTESPDLAGGDRVFQ